MQEISSFLSTHPVANYAAYLAFCTLAWSLSLFIYEKATPCKEWSMVAQGNKAAAWSIGGVAIGLAIPLCSLALRSDGWVELATWSAASLASQIFIWFALGHTVFSQLKASMEKDVESVGMLLGAFAVSIGLMVGACVS